jgi:hypothetical protein
MFEASAAGPRTIELTSAPPQGGGRPRRSSKGDHREVNTDRGRRSSNTPILPTLELRATGERGTRQVSETRSERELVTRCRSERHEWKKRHARRDRGCTHHPRTRSTSVPRGRAGRTSTLRETGGRQDGRDRVTGDVEVGPHARVIERGAREERQEGRGEAVMPAAHRTRFEPSKGAREGPSGPGPRRTDGPRERESGAPTDDPEPTSRTPDPAPTATRRRPAAEQTVEVEPTTRTEGAGRVAPLGRSRASRVTGPDAAGDTRERGATRRTEEPREEGRAARSVTSHRKVGPSGEDEAPGALRPGCRR